MIEIPALVIIGVLWRTTDNLLLAFQIAVVSVALLLPSSLFFAPLRPVPKQEPYPKSLGVVTVVQPVFGPVAYVVFLAVVYSVLILGASMFLFYGR